METGFKILKQIDPLFAKKILANMYDQIYDEDHFLRILITRYVSPDIFLHCAFYWSASHEGHEFWSIYSNKINVNHV